MADNHQQTEKDKLTMQLESLDNMKKESEKEYRKLDRQLMDILAKRKGLGAMIKNNYHKDQFEQLCDLNQWLLQNLINITTADTSGKLWFKELDQIPFEETKYDKSDETLEKQEVLNFIALMQGEWVDDYFPHWSKANDARIQFNELSNKDDKVDK